MLARMAGKAWLRSLQTAVLQLGSWLQRAASMGCLAGLTGVSGLCRYRMYWE